MLLTFETVYDVLKYCWDGLLFIENVFKKKTKKNKANVLALTKKKLPDIEGILHFFWK